MEKALFYVRKNFIAFNREYHVGFPLRQSDLDMWDASDEQVAVKLAELRRRLHIEEVEADAEPPKKPKESKLSLEFSDQC